MGFLTDFSRAALYGSSAAPKPRPNVSNRFEARKKRETHYLASENPNLLDCLSLGGLRSIRTKRVFVSPTSNLLETFRRSLRANPYPLRCVLTESVYVPRFLFFLFSHLNLFETVELRLLSQN